MDLLNGIVGLTSPVLYAGFALVVTLVAMMVGYFYTKRNQQGDVNKSAKKGNESKQTNANRTTQAQSNDTAPINDSALSKGSWPTEDKPPVLPMPDNIPDDIRRIIEMGFPGCPIFKRMGKPTADNEKKTEEPKPEPAVIEDKPQILPMPENIPENMKQILDMGFPGCPIFRRMGKPDVGEGSEDSRQPDDIGAFGAALRAAQASGEAPETANDVLPIRQELPEDLQKAIDAEPPCAGMNGAEGASGGELNMDEKSVMYAQALKKSLGTNALKDLAALAEVLKSPEAESLTAQRTCPRNVHCSEHCSCLFKVNQRQTTDDISENEEPMPKEVTIPEDAPENIKKILEMGFPGCPLFKRAKAPVKLGCELPPAIKDKVKASNRSIKKSKEGEGDVKSKELKRDPVEYCSHLQSEVKRTKQKVAIDKIEEKMTAEQREEERKIQQEQLAAIFNMMQTQQEKFGVDTMDEIKSQMKLYM